MGLPKTNDNSRGYCSQIAIFTRKSIFNNKIFDIENDKKKNSFLEEIFTRSYPFEEKNHVDFLRIIKQTYK